MEYGTYMLYVLMEHQQAYNFYVSKFSFPILYKNSLPV